ncbi:MAG TPA: tripartite tricarboxylate transporter substrate-binding protein [Burkholderiaceae bacterium]|jgi:tripartite-type tricarboxylate transporter receptor subunit TctC|nr:tripartite tricarboxylate transporter substrate-binding protein [Burkholderiaceae bacterium]
MTPYTRKRRALLAAGAAALTAAALPAAAQSDKPIRFVLPNATGSGVDAITRTAQPALARALGHPVIVDNQPGAGGVVGLQTLARSAPDGMTLSVVSNNVVIFPSVLKSLPFDMPGDFTPIAVVGYTPVVLVVNAKVPAANAREFIAWLKERKGEANYASGGNGTILHLATAMFLDEARVTARHIPYKGVGPMLTDLIGGQVEFATAALPSVQQHLKTGALKAIGMATAQRAAAAPEIPTFAEQGLPNYVVEAWFAVIGPKGMAAADVQRVHAAVVQAFNDPAVKEAMAKQGNVIAIQPPDKAAAFFRSELVKYAALVKKAGVEAQ